MTDWLLGHEPELRLGVFAGVLLTCLAWEQLTPRRPRSVARAWRWPDNLLLVLLNTLALRLAMPAGAVWFAAYAGGHDWGLLPALGVSQSVAVVAALLALDLLIYVQHVVFHQVPILWRLHAVHHADRDIDVTTGARFHPLEIGLSMIIKLGAIAALGTPPVAVFVFEVVLNAAAMFNHSNARLPRAVDAALRWLIVTPDMHRVHHSVVRDETNSNYGFNLPWWDRLFRTYRGQPTAGHDGMTIGLPEHQQPRRQTVLWMLALPFRQPSKQDTDAQ